jgi:hypothetical protein
VCLILALLGPVAPAAAQLSSTLQIFGGAPGAKVLSETDIPVRVQGDLVVTFHGDAAAGCAARGVCAYSGTIVVRPRAGQVGVVSYRRHGRTGHSVFVGFGEPDNAYTTSARVTRSVAGAPVGTCADAQSSLFPGVLSASSHGGRVTIRLLGAGGSLLQTRCAGPLDSDLAAVSPAATISLTRLEHGRTVLGLSAVHTFASHGFAGTIDSTLTLTLGKPNRQTMRESFPPGVKTHRVRTVIEQLSLVGLRGGLSATVQGTGDPIVCDLLDSCGARGTLSLSGPLREGSGQLIATGPARRPYADFLAALGLSRTGHARGIAVFGSVNWQQRVRARLSQAGGVCTDTALDGGVGLALAVRGESGGFTGSWRTRCPGPSLRNGQPILAGPLDRSMLGHREFTLRLEGSGTSFDDGYLIHARGRLSVVLRRGRITRQVSSEPGG